MNTIDATGGSDNDRIVAHSTPLSLSKVLEEEFNLLGPEEGETPVSAQPSEELSEQQRLKNHFTRVHKAKQTNALCLSGGGIRSASFSLGVIQGLAKRNLLSSFHYLSTVSGGGYVGGWLSAWIHRHQHGFDGVCEQLKKNEPQNKDSGMSEPETVLHLREYSNYLSPRLGIFSLDTWTLAATYLRNLVLSWVVLFPLLVALLLIPRLMTSLLWLPSGDKASILLPVGIALTLTALCVAVLSLPSLDRRACGRDQYESSKRPETRHVWAGIIIPMLLASIIWCVRSAWKSETTVPDQTAWELLVQKLLRVTPFFVGAAVAVWFIARFMLRKANPPRLLQLIFGFAILSFVLVPLIMLLRAWGVHKHQEAIIFIGVPYQLTIFLAMITAYVGINSRYASPDSDDDREWWGRLMGALMLVIGCWLTVVGIGLYGAIIISWIQSLPYYSGTIASIILSISGGIAGLMGGYSVSSGESHDKMLSAAQRIARKVPTVGAALFLLSLFLLLSTAINAVLPVTVNAAASELARLRPQSLKENERVVTTTQLVLPPWLKNMMPKSDRSVQQSAPRPNEGKEDWAIISLWTVATVVFAIGLVLGLAMNVNRLSLHAMYRARLIRAFLGASNPERTADPFTGFDPTDNLPIHHLRRLQRFTKEDLFEKGAEQPDRQLREMVKHWQAGQVGLGAYIHSQLEANDISLELLHLKLEDPAIDWEKKRKKGTASYSYLGLVLDQLNELLADSDLIIYSRFRNLATSQQKRRKKRLIRDQKSERDASQEAAGDQAGYGQRAAIEAAARQVEADGRPHLLNRLILEDAWPLCRPARALPGPLHIVNLALNLVSGKNLAWQQRKAASFIVSPLHSGFCLHAEYDPDTGDRKRRGGYRRSDEYGGGITVGTAIAISGAAASPNMGYHSSPAVTFLMTLFNARLGWWLGNPAEKRLTTAWRRFRASSSRGLRTLRRSLANVGLYFLQPNDREMWQLPAPRHPLSPLIDEALGRTSDDNDYVYLSDGGHFENLGLYEMVRRRCRFIVVSDASCDPKCAFDDLGNSVRKIRTDFGIPIHLDDPKFRYGKHKRGGGKYCAVGLIDYKPVDGPDAPRGLLLYVKAALGENLPIDVLNYAKTSTHFPHEPTSDQWFSESQFESYRRLGEECIDEICANVEGGNRSWQPEAVTAPGIDTERLLPEQLVARARQHVRSEKGVLPRAKPPELQDGWRLGPLPFSEENIAEIPEMSGVFRLFDGNEIAFIGRDRNIASRLGSHKSGKEGPTRAATHFDCELTTQFEQREESLFKEFADSHNGARPKWNTV
jgi:hypothetical protein